jgi:ABC-type nitrate/sulfonate/bicarbonate transport system substrate-binding protein
MSLTHLPAGFLPLLDSVLLVLAREKGFAEDEGIDLHLVKETSWANIRDRAAVGHFDVAQMLAPMPIAASLGLTPLAVPMITPMVLGAGNNAITVSAELWRLMAAAGAPGDLAAGPAGIALAKVVAVSGRKLKFGVVHQTSSHNYELRYWLAASGVKPDVDVEIVVLAPRLLPDAIASAVPGRISPL